MYRQARKETTVALNVKIEPGIKETLRQLADQDCRSMTRQLEVLVKQAANAREMKGHEQ